MSCIKALDNYHFEVISVTADGTGENESIFEGISNASFLANPHPLIAWCWFIIE